MIITSILTKKMGEAKKPVDCKPNKIHCKQRGMGLISTVGM